MGETQAAGNIFVGWASVSVDWDLLPSIGG
jgi:hypothetical protein